MAQFCNLYTTIRYSGSMNLIIRIIGSTYMCNVQQVDIGITLNDLARDGVELVSSVPKLCSMPSSRRMESSSLSLP